MARSPSPPLQPSSTSSRRFLLCLEPEHWLITIPTVEQSFHTTTEGLTSRVSLSSAAGHQTLTRDVVEPLPSPRAGSSNLPHIQHAATPTPIEHDVHSRESRSTEGSLRTGVRRVLSMTLRPERPIGAAPGIATSLRSLFLASCKSSRFRNLNSRC